MNRMFLNKSPNETKEFLLFWTYAATQEGCYFLVFHVSSRGDVGFVSDEHSPGGIADQVPAVTA